MSEWRRTVGVGVFLLLLGFSGSGLAEEPDRSFQPSGCPSTQVVVGDFSKLAEGDALPAEWEPLTFKKISRWTDYDLVTDEKTVVVRARSEQSASGLTRKIDVDLNNHPILRWRWKVENVIEKGDVRRKEGDDYAARLYITFAYDPAQVSFAKKVKYKVGRLLFGEIPIAALTYIWDKATPRGTIVSNAYTDFSKMVVVESGTSRVGMWVDETRNVYEDYVAAFGEEPPAVNGIAIMTDTDNTGEVATAYYGDIIFSSAP